MMLKGVPTEDHLARIYYELAREGANCIGQRRAWPYKIADLEHMFALASEMARYDPRLFDVLVLFLDSNWNRIDPLKVRSHYAGMQSPQAISVIAEFLLGANIVTDEKRFFLEYLQRGLRPVPLQFFYHHLYTPGGHMMMRAVESSLKEYKRWGFLACEAPVVDANKRTIGSQDAVSRRNILLNLLKVRGRIGLSDYMSELKHVISRQQALLDIKSIEGIRRIGQGRGSKWELSA